MLTSIKKVTSSFLAKTLIVIIILPFIFWGMGDVFRTGNQNVLVTIDSDKISVQNFVNYLGQLNLTEKQRKEMNKSGLLDKILSEYIGKKIILMEITKRGVKLSNASLKNIITSDEMFQKDNKFSRTEYEKFLLESRVSAPIFEENLSEQEKKRQLLTFLSEGVILPDFLIQKEFQNENQTKSIEYIELDSLYNKTTFSEDEIKKIYDENKQFLVKEYKNINYAELLPNNLVGQTEYNEQYFKKIDQIENQILDGKQLESFVKEFNLNVTSINGTDINKKDKSGKEIQKIDNNLFNKIFNQTEANKTILINQNNKYYISNISLIEKTTRPLEDKEVRDAIISQLKIKKIVEKNTNIVKEMSEGNFKKEQFNKFSKDNNLEIKKLTLKNISDESVFNKDIIKEIFKVKDSELQLITNSSLSKNYIIHSIKTELEPLDNNNKDFKEYETKAKLKLANTIYSIYDTTINDKYEININQKVLNRIKNTL